MGRLGDQLHFWSELRLWKCRPVCHTFLNTPETQAHEYSRSPEVLDKGVWTFVQQGVEIVRPVMAQAELHLGRCLWSGSIRLN